MHQPIVEIIESPVHGLIEVRRVPNPQKFAWGSIVLIKNQRNITQGWNFVNKIHKSSLLEIANATVTKRKDRHNRYDVLVHYGIKLADVITRYSKKD